MLRLILCFALAVVMQNNCAREQIKLMNRANNATATPMSEREEKKMDEREKLAKQLEKNDPQAATIVRSQEAKLEAVPTAFLRGGKIYRVEQFAPTRPVILFIGTDENDIAKVLSGDAEAFTAFAERAGLTLERRELRIDYLTAFLEMTKSSDERLVILQSVGDIKPRPNLSDEQQKRFAEFQDKFEKTIVPPKVTDAIPYQAVFFAIKGQNLVRLDLTLQPDGKVETKESVLESNLLIPYSL